jgi:hypothetical protein
METTLKIEKDKALAAHAKGGAAIKKLLEDLFGKRTFAGTITERIQSWDDVLEEVGMSQDQFDTWCKGLEEDEIAYRQAKLIAKALNEGVVLNKADTSQYKYFPWFKVIQDSKQPAGFGLSYYGFARARVRTSVPASNSLPESWPYMPARRSRKSTRVSSLNTSFIFLSPIHKTSHGSNSNQCDTGNGAHQDMGGRTGRQQSHTGSL